MKCVKTIADRLEEILGPAEFGKPEKDGKKGKKKRK